MFTTLSAPIGVQWEVTPVCNHNCKHCYNYWRDVQPTSSLTSNYFTLYPKIVSEILSNKVFSVIITGGRTISCYKGAKRLYKISLGWRSICFYE